MISVCTTIYKDPEAFKIFLDSIYSNSTGEFELVVVNDSNDKEIKKVAKDYPLKLIPFTKKDRIKHMNEMIEYYETNEIFDQSLIDEMKMTVEEYKKKDIDIWLPTPKKFNLGANKASGDILIFMPGDYYVYFDVASIEKKAREIMKIEDHIYGHFDWSQVDKDNIPETTEPIVKAQHGMRVVDRKLFDEIGGFDDRWFVRALGEDLFNEECRRVWGGMYRLKDLVHFVNDNMCAASLGTNRVHRYLSPSYSAEPEKHLYFVNRIKEVINYGT